MASVSIPLHRVSNGADKPPASWASLIDLAVVIHGTVPVQLPAITVVVLPIITIIQGSLPFELSPSEPFLSSGGAPVAWTRAWAWVRPWPVGGETAVSNECAILVLHHKTRVDACGLEVAVAWVWMALLVSVLGLRITDLVEAIPIAGLLPVSRGLQIHADRIAVAYPMLLISLSLVSLHSCDVY